MRWYMLNHKGIILQLQMEYFQAKIIVDFFFIFELQKKPNQNKKNPKRIWIMSLKIMNFHIHLMNNVIVYNVLGNVCGHIKITKIFIVK